MATRRLCDIFVNSPRNGYRPLACKQITVQTREVQGTGRANRLNYFLLARPNTIREHATIDLLYEVPTWLKNAHIKRQLFSTRITSDGATRITSAGNIRITAEDA